MNIIGQLSGRYTGTRDDKIFLIGAHYDSVKTTPGVDDNGSGITALLQALQLFTSPGQLFYVCFHCTQLFNVCLTYWHKCIGIFTVVFSHT